MRTAGWPRAIACSLLLPCLLAACAPAATLHRRGAPDLEAMIVANDERYFYVSDDDGRLFRVDRQRVYDVDHPGNLLIGVGAPIALTYGGVALAFSYGNDDGWNQTMARMFGALALVGVAVAGLGLTQWSASTSAAGPEGQLAVPLQPIGLPSATTAAAPAP